VKLIILIGILVVGMLFILSFTFFKSGQRILRESLEQNCDVLSRHVSKTLKEDLMMYYDPELDSNARTQYVGNISYGIHSVMQENIDGLKYACVIDRDGYIIAHTQSDSVNVRIAPQKLAMITAIDERAVQTYGDIIEHIHSIYARRANGEAVYLGVTVLGFSSKAIMQPVQRTTEIMISSTLIIALISIVLVFFVAHRMTRQIEELGKGVREISNNNLAHEIPVMSNDELGQLAREFNQMIVHLHEKQYMQKFVSDYTVKMIRDRYSNGMASQGQSRNITVLFSDVRNFTALTERLNAQQIVDLINEYLDIQATIIENNHGVVDKFMGDQVMAIFEGKNHVDNAVKTAVDIQKSIRFRNSERQKKGVTTLMVGIGLDVGEAVLGNMGSKNRMDYTVIGDVVNLAARLCALAKPGKIIAPAALEKYRLKFPTHRMQATKIKGKREPVTIIEILYDDPLVT